MLRGSAGGTFQAFLLLLFLPVLPMSYFPRISVLGLIGPGYFVYGLLLPTWFLLVGWKLYRLARD